MKLRTGLIGTVLVLMLSATAFGADLTLSDVQNAITARGADWVAGITSVSGLSLEEKANLCGVPPEPPPEPEETWSPAPETPIPIGTFDWRNLDGQNWMTSVKDQNPCGTCWDYAGIGVIEAQINIDKGDPTVDIDLSEQMTLSCWSGHSSWCSGGWPHYTFNQARDGGGIPDDACFPDTCKTTSCPVSGRPCAPCADWEGRAWTITSYRKVTPDTTEAYKAALQYGPLAVAIRVPDDWYFYKSGVYSPVMESPEWTQLFPLEFANHAVVLIGWADPGHDPQHPEGYWIVKNSWGPGWGDDGYGAIRLGDIEKYAYAYRVIGTVGPTPTIDLTLYYDWNRDGTFSSTSLSIDPTTQTFTTGLGESGDVRGVIQCLALVFHTGCCPLYSGPLYGFMDCRVGACENEPGWWYLGPPTGITSIDPGDGPPAGLPRAVLPSK